MAQGRVIHGTVVVPVDMVVVMEIAVAARFMEVEEAMVVLPGAEDIIPMEGREWRSGENEGIVDNFLMRERWYSQ